MTDFISQYRAAFEAVGRPLTASDAMNEDELEAAQLRLGHHLPKALLDFYRVAGNAGYFQNLIVLIKPENWRINSDDRLIFLQDFYGVNQSALELPTALDDPNIYDDISGLTNETCSHCLIFWLYYEAMLGQQMPFVAEVMNDLDQSTFNLIDSTWNLLIKYCDERVYNQSGRVIYLSPYGFGSNRTWHMWIGVTKHYMLEEISHELGVTLTEYEH